MARNDDELHEDGAWRAVVTRDVRQAHAFVVAVRTTGVFCRAGCPARTPRRENVRFFATAAQASAAGFRACKRCRPSEPDRATAARGAAQAYSATP